MPDRYAGPLNDVIQLGQNIDVLTTRTRSRFKTGTGRNPMLLALEGVGRQLDAPPPLVTVERTPVHFDAAYPQIAQRFVETLEV
jgi:hypothetical protein